MLRILQLSHSYYSNKKSEPVQVLSEINLSVQAGEFVSIVGPNGCGKSTLLRIIAGLHPPTNGRILLKGKRIEETGVGVGMVFQDVGLLPWKTIEKNIQFGLLSDKNLTKQEKKNLAIQYAYNFGLSGFRNHFPHQVSGGMRQKTAIARTLINEPDVILMDEPFAALDCVTRNQLHDFLISVWRETGKTILFVTHNVDEAVYLSERIIFLTQRPARIEREIEVDVPYPRNRTGRKEQEIRGEILRLMEEHAPALGWSV